MESVQLFGTDFLNEESRWHTELVVARLHGVTMSVPQTDDLPTVDKRKATVFTLRQQARQVAPKGQNTLFTVESIIG
jgi:hypothetical protein